jgi:hypothetical protein
MLTHVVLEHVYDVNLKKRENFLVMNATSHGLL